MGPSSFPLAVVDTWEWTPLITLIPLAGLATLPIEPYEPAMTQARTSPAS